MIRKIVVALDGSKDTEVAVPIAASIARRSGASLMIVHALNYAQTEYAYAETPEQWKECAYDRAYAYLDSVSATVAEHDKIQPASIVDEHGAMKVILSRDPAATADIVVMATHGHPTLGRITLGSKSHAVMCATHRDLLLVPVSESAASRAAIKTIAVPLDGSIASERVLSRVLEIARLYDAQVILIRVARRSDSAESYLKRTAAKLAAGGVSVVTEVVGTRGSAGRAILNTADRHNADLIILTRHSHPVARRILGGTADQVFESSRIPLLYCGG